MSGPRWWEVLAVAVLASALSLCAVWWVASQGYTLYYGDAESRLEHARRLIDSRTPGYDQIGSPWLPVPHVLMVPMVGNDSYWRSGMAGAVPSAVCFVLASVLLYAAARLALNSSLAAASAVALFALNPNILYLQSIPLTETVLYAGICGLLFASVWFARSKSLWAVGLAAVCSLFASLSRYEAWCLIPLVTAYFLLAGGRRRLLAAALFAVLASLGPLYWFGHNWYSSGYALNFYNGPYSHKGIYERALKAGMKPYAGDHDWVKAIHYYSAAAQLCSGLPLLLLGVAGAAVALWKRVWWPCLLLLAPCAFIVLSMYSGGSPIFVPHLWPEGNYYNTRYGAVAILLLAFGAAALVTLAPARFRWVAAAVLVCASVAPWLLNPRPDYWICWRESQVNSEARRAWTAEAAAYLKPRYQPGEGIFTSFGDLTGIFRTAGIPLRETLYDGNNPAWLAAVTQASLFLHEEWAVAISGDSVATTILHADRKGPHYRLVRQISVPGAPVIEIYKRD